MPRALTAAEGGALKLTPQPASRRDLRGENIQGRNPHRLDIARPHGCTTTSAACRRFPAPGLSSAACASRRCARQWAAGTGVAATALDDKLTIACGDGAVRLMQVQRAGKQPMSAEEFLRGTAVKAGAELD